MKALFVCNFGGHLAELDELAPRLPIDAEQVVWITGKSPQSKALLANRNHVFVPNVPARDFFGVLRSVRHAWRIIKRERPDTLVTTGAALAIGYMIVARFRQLNVHYIESAARITGPSLTGRIARRIPGIRLYTQHERWADQRWSFHGSIFEAFDITRKPESSSKKLRVLVTVGTANYPFDRLLKKLDDVIPEAWEITWQIGGARYQPRRGLIVEAMNSDELAKAHDSSDIVVAHAGVGSALMALRTGRKPILVPREEKYGENVDDHQAEIATYLQELGVASHRRVSELTLNDLQEVAQVRATSSTNTRKFALK